MDDMGTQSMMNYSSYDGFLTGLLVLLIKFLVLILIISVIIGIATWIKNNYFKNTNFTQLINQNPMVKAAVGIIAAIVILFILLTVFSYLTGRSYSYSMGNMSGYYNYGYNFSLSGIVIFLFKALTYFFTITLVISLIAYVMKQSGIHNFNFFQSANKNSQGSDSQTQYNSYGNSPKPADEQDNDNI